jgi:transcriptional regulator with XRE-family HTH domain
MSRRIFKDKKNKFNIANNLRKLRAYFDLTVKKLAENIDIEENTLRKYETDRNEPLYPNLIILADFFKISLDFLLCGDKTNYLRNIWFVSLAEKIDKLSSNERNKVESVISTLLKNKDKNDLSIQDNFFFELTDSINSNIKIIRTQKKFSQNNLGEFLNVYPTNIANYEKKSIPPAEKLIKISIFFNVSIHSLCTGKNLFFKFNNKNFQSTILKADKLLSLEDQKFLIKLMETILL